MNTIIETYHGIPVIDIGNVQIDTNIIDEQISQCQGVTTLYMNAYTWKAMDVEQTTYKGIPIKIRHELPFGMVAIEEGRKYE